MVALVLASRISEQRWVEIAERGPYAPPAASGSGAIRVRRAPHRVPDEGTFMVQPSPSYTVTLRLEVPASQKTVATLVDTTSATGAIVNGGVYVVTGLPHAPKGGSSPLARGLLILRPSWYSGNKTKSASGASF